MSACTLPLVGMPTCFRMINDRLFHTASERYTAALMEASGCVPILIPAVGARIDCTPLLDVMAGLLLTGSPSNVEPSRYGGPPSVEGTLHDPDRDATTLPLIREAVRRDLPILAICRGIQELNVALGGTLFQRVHELPGRLNHRSPQGPMPLDQRYGPAHPVGLTAGGVLAGFAGGAAEIMVNSLHSQGIDRPAANLRVEAVAPDGQIEGVSLPGARFVVGVQWHPEYKPAESAFAQALFKAFGNACRATSGGIDATVRAA